VTTTETPLKLNLGAGPHPIAGYLNVDKFPPAELVLDLEVTPWPWADSSVGEIRMSHVMEHPGGYVQYLPEHRQRNVSGLPGRRCHLDFGSASQAR
jgi:hypothetical protein